MRVLVLQCFILLCTGAALWGLELSDAGFSPCEYLRGKYICSCVSAQLQEAVLSTDVVPEGTSHLRIENCTKVRVKSHTWEGHRDIRTVDLFNIKELIIESDAFSWNETLALNFHLGLSVNIFNASIREIPSYSFKGHLTEITLSNVSIGSIQAFAFASLHHTEKLELLNCIVKEFKAQAFKKFAVNRLHITGGHFSGTVPSRTMLELEVRTDLSINKLTVDIIKSSALIIHGPKTFRLQDSVFQEVEGEAFYIKTRGKTLIQNNVFISLAKGAFLHINVNHFILHMDGLQELRFENNTIQKFEDGCLIFNTTSYNPQIQHVVLNETCSCALLESWSSQLSLHSDPEQNRHKHDVDPSNPANPFWCRRENGQESKASYIRFYDFNGECVMSSGVYMFLIIIVSCSLVVVVVALLIIFWCRRRRKNNKSRWINVPTSHNNYSAKSQKLSKGNNADKGNKHEQDSRYTMVVPDGRTYRETELHVIVERTEPILEPDYVDTTVNERDVKSDGKKYIETHH